MQVDQAGDGHPRSAETQSGAGGRIEHPGRHHGDDARHSFDMKDLTTRTPLAIVPTQPPTMQRMPAIVDDHLITDMGRMTP